MKKIYFIAIALVLGGFPAFAQIAAEDASGQSSVAFKSSSLNINITDAQITANWNNFKKLDIMQPQLWIWGLSASSKNKDGISGLFKGDKITPDSKFNALLGFRKVAGFDDYFKAYHDKVILLTNPVFLQYKKALTYKGAIEDIIKRSGLSTADQKALTDKLDISGDINKDQKKTDELINNGNYDKSALTSIKDTLSARLNLLEKLQPVYGGIKKQVDDLQVKIQAYKTKKTKVFTFYLKPGLSANSLSFYNGLDTGALSGRFSKATFRGGFADLGANFDYGGSWTFGLSAGVEHFNNIDSLESTDYVLKTAVSKNNSELSSQKNYSAYEGSYIVYDRVNIKTDMLYWAEFGDKGRLVWNTLYTRFIFPLADKRINQVINAGTAINFYKEGGKFAGGFYLQSNDVFNNMSTGEKFTERLSFGVVAKFSFDSIISRDLN